MHNSRPRRDRGAASAISENTTGPRGGIEIELVKEKEKTNKSLPPPRSSHLRPNPGYGSLRMFMFIVCVYRLARITDGEGERKMG